MERRAVADQRWFRDLDRRSDVRVSGYKDERLFFGIYYKMMKIYKSGIW